MKENADLKVLRNKRHLEKWTFLSEPTREWLNKMELLYKSEVSNVRLCHQNIKRMMKTLVFIIRFI